jgi:hypothetical protein
MIAGVVQKLKLLIMSIGGQAVGPELADPGARTPISAGVNILHIGSASTPEEFHRS